jgi:GntR family transcriptional regulator/MocR family aminotransferase
VNLNLDGKGVLYEQLARALKQAILSGRFVKGSRLPTTRALALVLGMSRNTVLNAYELLCAEQLVVPRAGSGTRVADVGATSRTKKLSSVLPPQSRYVARARALGPITLATVNSRARYNLQYGEPLLGLGLFNSWRRKLSAAALRAEPGYPAPPGHLPLRRAICDHLARRRGIVCTPEDVLVVGGTQQALTIVARVLLDEGHMVVLEDPHYQLAMHALSAHGARIVSVPTDREGLVIHAMPKGAPRLIYVTPSHQFPSGAVMSVARRIELLDYAAGKGSWIFEDDYDAEFRFDGPSIPALRSIDTLDRVVYVGSFSKTLFASLRLGYIVCPKALRNDLLRAKTLDDLACPAIEQAALAAFMQSRQFDKHLRKLVAELNVRRAALLEGLERRCRAHLEIAPSTGGMHIVAWLSDLNYAQLDQLLALGASHGLGLHPIHPYFRSRPPRPGLLMGFAGLSGRQLRDATMLMGRCLDRISAQRCARTAA